MACLQSSCSLLARDTAPSSLSSPASSLHHHSCPLLPCSRKVLFKSPKCALSEDDARSNTSAAPSVGRSLLAGVVAAGAALAVFTNMSPAIATGPGNDGARRTAEEADKLLKAADQLNVDEAPERFGPGRPGSVQDPLRISQIAGSGVMANKEGVTNEPNAAVNLSSKAGPDKTSGVLEIAKNPGAITDNIKGAVQGGIEDVAKGSIADNNVTRIAKGALNNAKGAANDAKGALSQAKPLGDVADNVKGAFSQANPVGAVAGNAKGALSQAKGKTDEVASNVQKNAKQITRDGLGRFRNPVKDVIESSGDGANNVVGQAQGKKGQLGNAARNAVGMVQSKNPGGTAIDNAKGAANNANRALSQGNPLGAVVDDVKGALSQAKPIGAVADNAKGALSQAKGKTDEVVSSVQSNVKQITRDGLGRFRNPVDGAKDLVGQAQGKKGELGNAARNAVGMAEGKKNEAGSAAREAIGQSSTNSSSLGNDLGKAEGGLLKPFQQGFQNLKETTNQAGADARSTVADVVSKNTP